MQKFMDSFDHYATAEIDHKYDGHGGGTIISPGNGRRGSQSMRFPAAGDYIQIRKDCSGIVTGCTLGFALKIPAYPTANAILTLFGNGTGNQCYLVVTPTGAVALVNADTTIKGTSSAAVIPLATWVYFEIRVWIDNSAGQAEVHIDGVTVLNLTGIDTLLNAVNPKLEFITIFNPTAGASGIVDIDDLYLNDATPMYNTGFWGDVRVDAHHPTAAGANGMSTPSSGVDRYAMVDETLTNSDTDYNTLAAINDIDTLTLQDLIPAGGTVRGVQLVVHAKKTSAPAASLSPVLRYAGVDNVATAQNLTTAYKFYITNYDLDYSGLTTQWTEAEINATEIGYKKIS